MGNVSLPDGMMDVGLAQFTSMLIRLLQNEVAG